MPHGPGWSKAVRRALSLRNAADLLDIVFPRLKKGCQGSERSEVTGARPESLDACFFLTVAHTSPKPCAFRTIAHLAARNFPCDMVAVSTIGGVGGLVVRQAQRDVASDLDGLSDRLFDAGGIKAIEVLMSDRRCCHGAFDDGSFNGGRMGPRCAVQNAGCLAAVRPR